MFHDSQYSEEGIYCIHITKNGIKHDLCIDDYFICRHSEPVFAKARDHVIWVLLIEKAYAKVHGSYKRIEGGQAFEAMRDLTGAPAYVYDIKNYNLA